MVATTGTAAATAGLRYKRQWTVLSVLDVLDGKAQSVVPEPPDLPAARDAPITSGRHLRSLDFLVQENGTQIWHEVKYGSGPWTISHLAREGLLSACWAVVVLANGRFVLDFRADAGPLGALADAARRADSWESFHHDCLNAGRLRADFERLRDEWGKPTPEQTYLVLKRVTVNQATARDVADLIQARLATMVTGSPKMAEMTLERLVEDSSGRELVEAEVLRHLATHSIFRKEKPSDAQRHGRRAVAGLRSDAPTSEDLLGVSGDVDTLAELIAATDTRPPLAIALIGDWGAGKSTLMLQVEGAIEALAARSKSYPGKSAFAGNVRQVRFNAWHYSDDQVWAGLISHLFQVLAAPDISAPDTPLPDAAKIRKDRADLRAKVAAKQDLCDQIDVRLEATGGLSRPSGLFAGLNSPWVLWQEFFDYFWLARRDVRTAWPALAGWAVVLCGSFAAWHFLRPELGVIIGVVGAAASPLIAMGSTLRSWHSKLTRLRADKHAQMVARQHDEHEELRRLREQLALIDAAAELSAFLDKRGSPAAYRGFQGLLGQVRADLEHLSETLAEARAEWIDDGAPGQAPARAHCPIHR